MPRYSCHSTDVGLGVHCSGAHGYLLSGGWNRGLHEHFLAPVGKTRRGSRATHRATSQKHQSRGNVHGSGTKLNPQPHFQGPSALQRRIGKRSTNKATPQDGLVASLGRGSRALFRTRLATMCLVEFSPTSSHRKAGLIRKRSVDNVLQQFKVPTPFHPPFPICIASMSRLTRLDTR
jgi:hypothetical protein